MSCSPSTNRIQIIDIKFQDIEPPSGQVAEAFREVTNAREEKNTKINNAAKYENDRIPKARGEAQALLENAEGQKKSRILNAEGDVAKFNAIFGEYKKIRMLPKVVWCWRRLKKYCRTRKSLLRIRTAIP